MRVSRAAEAVRKYVMSRPFLRECIEEGVINYSALARLIADELRKAGVNTSVGAVKMTLIRIREDLLRVKESLDERVRKVIASSVIELQTDLVVVNAFRNAVISKLASIIDVVGNARFFQLTQGAVSLTLIVARETLSDLMRVIGEDNVIEVLEDQTAIVMISPEEITRTSGVIAYISSALANNGVNITQIISCYRETVIVCDREDASKAYSILEDLITSAKEKRRLSSAIEVDDHDKR